MNRYCCSAIRLTFQHTSQTHMAGRGRIEWSRDEEHDQAAHEYSATAHSVHSRMGNGAPQSLRGRHSDSRITSIRLDGLGGDADVIGGACVSESSCSTGNSTMTLRYNHEHPIADAWRVRARSRSLSEAVSQLPNAPALQAVEEVKEDHNSSASSIKADSNNNPSPRSPLNDIEANVSDEYEDEPFEDETIEWKKGEALGSGSYGTVYLARDERTGALMAVKEILVEDENEDDVRNASREVELLQSLRHQNIVKYLGSQIDYANRRLHIFTEWVPGGNLEQNRRRFGGTERVVRRFTRQILLGVAYLHSKHIVHHDIKPTNMLVDQNGVVKLADFGSSRLMSTTTLINNESMRGTPNYIAPEVIKQSGPRTFKSDIWSIGCSVLRLLTGRPLWGDKHFDSQIALLYYIAHMEHLPPLPAELSADAKSFMSTCLEVEPTKRPSAAELLSHPFVRDSTSRTPRVAPARSPSHTTLPPLQLAAPPRLQTAPRDSKKADATLSSAPVKPLPMTAPSLSSPTSSDLFLPSPRANRGDSMNEPEHHDESIDRVLHHSHKKTVLPGQKDDHAGSMGDEDEDLYTFSEFSKTVATGSRRTETTRKSASTSWDDQPILTDAARADRERRLQIEAEEKRKREERERRFQEELVEFRKLMLQPQQQRR